MHADIEEVLGAPLLERLLSGSRAHAGRRVEEMTAAAAYVDELGVSRASPRRRRVVEQLARDER